MTQVPRTGLVKQELDARAVVQDGDCSFKDIGCTFKGPTGDLHQHMASATISHLSLMSALLLEHQREIQRLETKISEQRAEISDQKAESLEQQAEIERQTMELSEQDTKILLLRSGHLGSMESCFIWRISDYSLKLRDVRYGKSSNLLSEPFYTSTYGYKLQAGLDLEGGGHGGDTYIPIFVKLLPGEFDAILHWPFVMDVTFTLMDQPENLDEASHIVAKSSIKDPSEGNWNRPLGDSASNPWGFRRFVSHGTLDTRHYVEEDTIFIKIEIN